VSNFIKIIYCITNYSVQGVLLLLLLLHYIHLKAFFSGQRG